ncbi:DNA polymerase III subunit beta [Mesorhizobium opportunistum]|uniref:Beta sliding clamp n=1 Tax=Mesorhizobium opportunistum (strain LMG 24607 / HAMBI 3007 / WSM2075) TaxID=536019 RepID=F7XZU3_MESOW|nr:DNA polymerase III subunit beta [Mesorhizobium opportunistum]AEH88157.1 DNA polymerase III, beta subunit [Mesorhizobium opportunistum WSM2075]
MTIKFSVAAFAEAAKAIRNIPGGSRNIEILDHARMEVARKKLTLTMSDLDIEACATIPCEGASIVAAIPRAVLEFFIARDGGGDDSGTLTFADDMKTVVARHGKGRLTMPILPGADFFLIGAGTQDWSMAIRANELVELLRTCVSAMDETRHFIQGVLLHVAAGEDGASALRTAATDGHRVHTVGVEAPELTGGFAERQEGHQGITIPDRTVKELIRIFDGDESEVTLSGAKGIVTVEGEAIRVTSKLIDAAFADYARLLQAPGAFRISVAAKALDAAIGRLLVLPRKDGKGKAETARPIRMTPVDGGLKLEIKGNDADAEDLIDCEVEGQGEPIVVNCRYIRDALAAAGGTKVTFAPIEGNAIGVRMLPDNDRSSFLLMQMRF